MKGNDLESASKTEDTPGGILGFIYRGLPPLTTAYKMYRFGNHIG